MTANKMPEMPKLPKTWRLHQRGSDFREVFTDEEMEAYAKDYGRACYLAGIEAARACVPDKWPDEANHDRWVMKESFNKCRDQTLTNLTALEQEAKK